MKRLALAAALLMIGGAAQAGGLQSLTGIWAEGSCSTGEQWEITHVSGSKYQISVNEWGCDLRKPSQHGNTLSFRTTCYAETDSYKSNVTIALLNNNTIKFVDSAKSNTVTLNRCR